MACNITTTGRLGRDPEIKYLESGQQVTKFTICARQAKIRGEDPPPLWFTVEVWGGSAQWIADNLKKGEMVYVSGELSLQQWTHRETGELKEALTIKRAQVEKLSASRQEGDGEAPAAPAQAVVPAAPAAPAAHQEPPQQPAPVHPTAQQAAHVYSPFV